MRKALLALLAVIAVGCADSGKPQAARTVTVTESTSPVVTTPSPSPSPTFEPEPEPEAKYGLATCDVNLFTGGGFLNTTSTLVGATEIRNTGEVPVTARVTFKWVFLGRPPLEARPKTVTVNPGADRYVNFVHPGLDSDGVDAFQAHPGYYDSENCKTQAFIV